MISIKETAVVGHPRLTTCLEKEQTLAYVTANASCIEKEKEHTLEYAYAHATYASMRVWSHALRKTRTMTVTNRDGDQQTQN
jgi:hypothetical protein